MVLAYLLDLAIGDPRKFPHPVRWMGCLISSLEVVLRRPRRLKGPRLQRLAGFLLSVIVVVSVYALSAFALYLALKLSTIVFIVVAVVMLWSTLSVKGLHKAAADVSDALQGGRINEARRELSFIVGRDTDNLEHSEIERALVETISENTCDGIIAPLFFFMLGGPSLALAYKAVNTLDSMLGYRNEKYLHFGWFPARLDDFANYIPARITGALMVVASFMLGFNWRGSAKILIRDGSAHPSPNAGYPEAAVAGALGMTLGGSSVYGDLEVVKPLIGERLSKRAPQVVASTVRIMHLTGMIMATVIVIFLYLF